MHLLLKKPFSNSVPLDSTTFVSPVLLWLVPNATIPLSPIDVNYSVTNFAISSSPFAETFAIFVIISFEIFLFYLDFR